MLKVVGISRLHVTLLDLEGKWGRLDGGVGIALERPRVVVRIGECAPPIQPPFQVPGVCLDEDYEPHVGLGHTTQLALAVAKASAEFNGVPMDSVRLARLVGRGSTSGVGVHAFQWGGMVLDGGHSVKVKPTPSPSDYSSAPPPPLLARFRFPWKLYVNIPSRGRRIFGEEERAAFRARVEGTAELARVVLMGLLPSVVEEDVEEALRSIDAIQSLGFKRVEWLLQSEEVRSLASSMRTRGFYVGLSSFGPAIYTFLSSEREGRELISTFGGFVTEPNNRGAKVEWSTTNS
ncbi:beta-ribofuranosylaminobenzene 5'-phosphate synthase [Sulfodiicoccus acidiphilus]|uniref:Beta-ribofuranosylaminobenzene 5'-phosphate synthase n=1 Tax=Sulfodiicoccus acidiphilus TaxID=1670455 RepID=A0A348B2X8_9CREN|nr:beta-ribofuranosylaminobenzene 5'-phosphate synthase family protein [Sulfodiicoccus acidiphilus]BBD72530.1 beta-ribofuranosylaminobenzene 5'-phosphate synthase [Sulfodiicoccus acidiphilus]GGT93880.1 beta-ribofuranosylaminobenzene 5'-phosphate synthase [Sulfodiicoccus acidiphilus]